MKRKTFILLFLLSSTCLYRQSTLSKFDTFKPHVGFIENNGQTSQTATNLEPGVYSVLAKDSNGCTVEAEVTINAYPLPNAEFISSGSLCINVPVSFESLHENYPYSFNWDFGDGHTSTMQNPDHIFSIPGTYNVRLVVTGDHGCTHCYTKTIDIASDCCALDGIVYNDDDFPTDEITDNTMWDSSIKINKPITVKAPNTLTIAAYTTIEFGPFGKIIVENGNKNVNMEGAKLVIQEGAKLTSVTNSESDCSVMWQGIEVWGRSSLTHSATDKLYQGKIEINTSAKIENAHIGVLLGRKNICFGNTCPTPPIAKCATSPYVMSFSGGIIEADGALFTANAVSVHFARFSHNNASYIRNSTFEGGILLDPGYNNLSGYIYENTNVSTSPNPLFATANSEGKSSVGIYNWATRNLKLDNNVFANNMVAGIESFDSPINVSYSQFENLDYGIRVFNTSSALQGNRISNNQGFRNISVYPLQITAGRYDMISNNTFGDEDALFAWSEAGIMLDNTSNFNILDNTFNKINKAINVVNSADGGGSIASLLKVVGNLFFETPLDVETSGSNNNLQIRCNTSYNDLSAFYSGTNWDNFGRFTHQGQVDYSFEARGPAGNAFHPALPLNNEKKAIKNHYQISLQVWPEGETHYFPAYYTYYRHGGNTDMHYPQLVPAPAPYSKQYNFNAESSTYNSETSCIPCVKPLDFLIERNEMLSKISDLEVELLTVTENLDNGQTEDLIEAINKNRPVSAGQLKDMLLASSPLSDVVLIAFINRPHNIPAGTFKEVIIPNSPVSDVVMYELESKLATLPPGIAEQIRHTQTLTHIYRTSTAVLRELEAAQTEYRLLMNAYINTLLEEGEIDEAISVLQQDECNHSLQVLISTYLALNSLEDAENLLNVFVPENSEDADWKDLHLLLLYYATEEKTVFEMSTVEEAFIRQLAGDNSCSLASKNAQSILRLVYGEDFPPCHVEVIDKKGKTPAFAGNEYVLGYLGNNIPNPFGNTTAIPYNLPENIDNASIGIYDITGKKLMEIPINENMGEVIISLENYKAGIYFYSLIIKGNPLQTKRMVLIK